MSELQSASNRENVKPQTPAPALEPFEKLYGTVDDGFVVQTLATAPNPVMLDGLWKKRPRSVLKTTCRQHLYRFGNSMKIAFRKLLDRIGRLD